jgi:SAM-dependent methyltransferase
MNWLLGLAAFIVAGFLLDREIYFYEGAHLGPRLQAWLYNRWAKKYDEGKRASQAQDDEMLAQPLLRALRAVDQPFILDFAAGTGRLSEALVRQREFAGHIIALDLSLGMLEQAAVKLSRHLSPAAAEHSSATVEFLRHVSMPLPFPDAAFDAVCALEVLELFPAMEEPLQEFSRVLRPGGILLTSRGTEDSGRKAKVKSKREFSASLEGNGFEQIQVTQWWRLFDRVIASKSGSSRPNGPRPLSQVLRCKKCGQQQWQRSEKALQCKTCGREISITANGIVLH